MKLLKLILLFVLFFSFFSCKKSDSMDDTFENPGALEASMLISPINNEPCNQGNVLENNSYSRVAFQWNSVENADMYTLEVENLENNSIEKIITDNTKAELNLKRGVSYRWKIVSKQNLENRTSISDAWQFENAATGTETHIPNPAELISPEFNATTTNASVVLTWSATDIDQDLVEYEVYIGTSEASMIQQSSLDIPELNITLEANTNYFWKVHAIDANENTSISSIFKFKTGM